MKWLMVVLAAAAGAQQPPATIALVQIGSRFLIRSAAGVAEVEWYTPSTFRYRRGMRGEVPGRTGRQPEPVAVTARDAASEITFQTEYLTASVSKEDLRVRVARRDGTPLMSDATAATTTNGDISWERAAEPGMSYYGLGSKTGASLNLRGMLVKDAVPFLFTGAGYGELHVAGGQYEFDLERLRKGRYRISIRNANVIDYYFYYGPTPKEIFEERHKTAPVDFARRADAADFPRMVEQSLSGVILPVEVVAKSLPPDLLKRLDAYFSAYAQEVHDRGFPILHPVPFQFPGDPEADLHRDQAMLGDELLVATGPAVYLPRGIWTNLVSNETVAGRKTTVVTPPAVFARNGSIVPLAGAGTVELHYFPKLGAEFFLLEEEVGDYTQVHAAPAADIMRLEIEAKAAGDYTWVVHHLDGVKSVAPAGGAEFALAKDASDLRDRTWYYDAALHNVYVRNRVAAGQDLIVNLSF